MSRHRISLLAAGLLFSCAALSAETETANVAPAATEQPAHDHGGTHGRHEKPQGMRDWTASPMILPSMRKAMGENNAAVMLNTKNIQPDRRLAYAPNGAAPQELAVTMAGTQLEPLPKIGNYYWVTAREEQPSKVTVASTAYYFSNPNGPAPTSMLLKQKNELEIIPQPLPRAHSSYRENEDWKFLLRFNGQPLPGQQLKMETQNGSKLSFTSDAQGMVNVHFPDDYKPAEEKSEDDEDSHNHAPRRAAFVLLAEHMANGTQYVTAFNHSYRPDAYTTRSLAWGGGFALFGMALASPLLRRKADARNNKPATSGNASVNKDDSNKGE